MALRTVPGLAPERLVDFLEREGEFDDTILLVLSDNGIINTSLLSLGLISEPLTLAYTRGATILGFVLEDDEEPLRY